VSVACSKAVWESRLETHLKMTALALADFADPHGGSIRPSMATIARMTGRSERLERANVTALQIVGVVVAETGRRGGVRGGKGISNCLRLDLEALARYKPGNRLPGKPGSGLPPWDDDEQSPTRKPSAPYPEVEPELPGSGLPPIRQDPPVIHQESTPPAADSSHANQENCLQWTTHLERTWQRIRAANGSDDGAATPGRAKRPRRSGRTSSARTPAENVRVIAALVVRELLPQGIKDESELIKDESELIEETKRRAAGLHIAYDSATVYRAVSSAIAQVRKGTS
jgi:hypothetical protein